MSAIVKCAECGKSWAVEHQRSYLVYICASHLYDEPAPDLHSQLAIVAKMRDLAHKHGAAGVSLLKDKNDGS